MLGTSRFTHTRCTDHKNMNVPSIHQRGGLAEPPFAAHDDPLRQQRGRTLPAAAFAPNLGPVLDPFVSTPNFAFSRPTRCAVLAIACRAGLDIVETVVGGKIRNQRHKTKSSGAQQDENDLPFCHGVTSF